MGTGGGSGTSRLVEAPPMPGPRGGPGIGVGRPGGSDSGSLGGRLSETLRVGIDAVNVGLASGLRILGGLADLGYGMGGLGFVLVVVLIVLLLR